MIHYHGIAVAEIEHCRPLPAMRAWHERNVLAPLERVRCAEFRCPDCEDDDEERRHCPICHGFGWVFFDTLRENSPERAERIELRALQGRRTKGAVRWQLDRQ